MSLSKTSKIRIGTSFGMSTSRDHIRYHSLDRKSTRLNSSHSQISYAVFCLKKKNKSIDGPDLTTVPFNAMFAVGANADLRTYSLKADVCTIITEVEHRLTLTPHAAPDAAY